MQRKVYTEAQKEKHFFKFKTTVIFRVRKLDTLIRDCLGSQLVLSTLRFDLNSFVF